MNFFRRLFGQAPASRSETPSTEDSEPALGASAQVAATPAAPPGTQAAMGDTIVEPLATASQSQPPTTAPLPPEPRFNIADGVTRPLPPEPTAQVTSGEHMIFGQITDVGVVRGNNQDAALSFFSTVRSADERPDFGVFVVADGMGGHHDGEKASALSTRTLVREMTNAIYLPMLNGDPEARHIPVTEVLVKAVQKANQLVLEEVPDGGTTLTAVTVIGDLAYVAHVGDSRAYLINGDGVEQITRDHSLVQRLIELDQLTPEEAAEHPQKNVLYRALGQSETLEVDTLTRRLPPKARVLVCSDGLWNQVPEQEIAAIVRKYDNPQEACEQLVAVANAHGGLDNVTAILIYVPG